MEANELTKEIIGTAIEAHRALGPALPESVCEIRLCHELEARGIQFDLQE